MYKADRNVGYKVLAAILLALFLVYLALVFLLPRPQNYVGDNPLRKTGERPLLIAHGGGNGEFPDNTLEAFYNAYSVDPSVMMETDVSITADGVLILSHDTTLDRKTNVTGAIADWTYEDLVEQKVDFGYHNPTVGDDEERVLVKYTDVLGEQKAPTDVKYPKGVTARDKKIFKVTTLEELLKAFPENRINVEIKQSGETGERALAEALRLIEKYDAYDRVVLASFHEDIYRTFQQMQADGEVPENFLCSPATGGVVKFVATQVLGLDTFFWDRIAVLQIPTEQYGISLDVKALTDTAHRHNVAVHYWTVNSEEDMRHLVEIGADGIMTDLPSLLYKVYESYGFGVTASENIQQAEGTSTEEGDTAK